jgi:hypothetical protein
MWKDKTRKIRAVWPHKLRKQSGERYLIKAQEAFSEAVADVFRSTKLKSNFMKAAKKLASRIKCSARW